MEVAMLDTSELDHAFDDEQKVAIWRFLERNAASRRSIEEVRLEIEKLRAETTGLRADLTVQVERLRADSVVEIEKLRGETRTEIAKVNERISKLDSDLSAKLLRYQVGGAVSLAIFIAVVRPFS